MNEFSKASRYYHQLKIFCLPRLTSHTVASFNENAETFYPQFNKTFIGAENL